MKAFALLIKQTLTSVGYKNYLCRKTCLIYDFENFPQLHYRYHLVLCNTHLHIHIGTRAGEFRQFPTLVIDIPVVMDSKATDNLNDF